MFKRLSFFLCILALALPGTKLFGKVVFTGLNLSGDNRLLFRADSETNGTYTQNALFVSLLSDLSLRQITVFPEKIDLIENGRTLQIRSAFGAQRVPVSGGLPQSIPGFPAFSEGTPVMGGRVEGLAASGDGRWLLYVDPITAAYGNLILIDTTSGVRTLISPNVERPDADFPARWSPDSRVFVYCRGGALYYYTLVTANSVDERYRFIGEGAINSVTWGNGGDFFYIQGSTVHRGRSSELFARVIYGDFLDVGIVAGKIPFEFDPNFDAFWIAPDSRSLLLSKGGRNIFYFPLETNGASITVSLPYIMLPRSCYNLNVLWSPQGLITVIASVPAQGGGSVIAYRLDPEGLFTPDAPGSLQNTNPASRQTGLTFQALDPPVGSSSALSPDGTKALLWGDGGMALYDYEAWNVLQVLSNRPSYAGIWVGNGELIMGDRSRIERFRLSAGAGRAWIAERHLICLSSVEEFGFEERGDRILARTGGAWFSTDGRRAWAETTNPSMRRVSVSSGSYRVYLERQSSGPYENLPMIRNTQVAGTAPLLPAISYTAIPPARESGDASGGSSTEMGEVFTHAHREGLREIAVCFDLYDDPTGLPEVLETLRRFGLRATFFLNGEFIRRNPSSARDIALAGHETASLFYSSIDLSDSRYRIQDGFIIQGLARNEDEFFNATGSELGLLWHAPYYVVSSEITTAAARAGYRTIGRDVDPMDWMTQAEARRIVMPQYSAADMIDRVVEQKQPGSIVPIRLGLLSGGRRDYLFSRLGVLLDALIRDGYSLIPVSTLIEHTR
jgi:peptidoglycan/xylan/chitin deacetylase (PgdA/CDA1 family)